MMAEHCNICGRELMKNVLVVDTSLDMRPIQYEEIRGNESDLICIDCAVDSVENPPVVCSRCGQPIEFNEKLYILKEAISKPGGPQVEFDKHINEENCICGSCFEEFRNPEYDIDT